MPPRAETATFPQTAGAFTYPYSPQSSMSKLFSYKLKIFNFSQGINGPPAPHNGMVVPAVSNFAENPNVNDPFYNVPDPIGHFTNNGDLPDFRKYSLLFSSLLNRVIKKTGNRNNTPGVCMKVCTCSFHSCQLVALITVK